MRGKTTNVLQFILSGCVQILYELRATHQQEIDELKRKNVKLKLKIAGAVAKLVASQCCFCQLWAVVQCRFSTVRLVHGRISPSHLRFRFKSE